MHSKDEKFMALLIYVDDIILIENNTAGCEDVKSYLDQCFNIKDLGKLKHFLGIEVARYQKGVISVSKKICLEHFD